MASRAAASVLPLFPPFCENRAAINPLRSLLWFLNVISSFDLFAGTDGHDHGCSTALFKDPRVLRDVRRVPRCRGREIQKILERSVLKCRSYKSKNNCERSRNQQETTAFLSAYNRLKPTLLERSEEAKQNLQHCMKILWSSVWLLSPSEAQERSTFYSESPQTGLRILPSGDRRKRDS